MKWDRIIIFVLLLLMLGSALYIKQNAKPTGLQPSTTSFKQPTTTPVSPITITFSPSTLSLNERGQGSLKITVSAPSTEITTIQLEIAYDPRIFTQAYLNPGTFFPSEKTILNIPDPQSGRLLAAFSASSKDITKGTGTVAILTLFRNPTASDAGQTTIRFLPKTSARAKSSGESIPVTTTNATVNYTQFPLLPSQ